MSLIYLKSSAVRNPHPLTARAYQIDEVKDPSLGNIDNFTSLNTKHTQSDWGKVSTKSLSRAVDANPNQMINSRLPRFDRLWVLLKVGLDNFDQEYNYGDLKGSYNQTYKCLPSSCLSLSYPDRHGNRDLSCVDKNERRPPPNPYQRKPFAENSKSFARVLISALERFIHRSRMVSAAKPLTRLMLWSPLLFLPTASALTPDHTTGLHNSRGMEAIGNISKDLLSVSPLPRSSQKILTLICER